MLLAIGVELAADVIAVDDELAATDDTAIAELIAVELATLLALLVGAGVELPPPPPQAVSPRVIRDRDKIR